MTLMAAATSKRRGGSAAAVLDFAVAQILGDDTVLGALIGRGRRSYPDTPGHDTLPT